MSAPAKWFFLVLAAILFPLGGEAAETIIYKKVENRELKLLVEKPEGWTAADRRPAIVFFFGGGWVGGTTEQFRRQSTYLAARGMVGVRVEYRTVPKGDPGPPVVCCGDAKSAMRYVRSHAAELGIDPGRIAAAGGSAGGHLAAFTALVPGLDAPGDDPGVSCVPDALVLFNPVFNNGPGEWGAERVGARYKEFSPAHNIKKGAPPTIVFLGDKDDLIPVRVLDAFKQEMTEAGSRCETQVYPGMGHGFFNSNPSLSRTMAETDKFLVSLGWIQGEPTVEALEVLNQPREPKVKPTAASVRPNIIYILTDDLGYGDVRALNPERGKIATPVLDRLAAQGMIFTDAHSGSSVCTPTRYGVMTGRYAWRTSLVSGVLGGASPPLIAENRLTVAALLRQQGYATACIGKWHLGLEWAKWQDPVARKQHPGWQFDFARPFKRGPVTLGFDSFFGISASLDMAPFAFIENDRLTAAPTAEKEWVRKGPAAPDFEAIDVLPALTRRTVETIGAKAAAAKNGQPFFIYLPYASPHTPILPSPAWQGKSGLSDYADFVMQTDACVGEVLAALDQHGVADNTLVIFTSDNGCSPAADIEGMEKKGHFANGDWRGMKADIWEGGHRVPFLVRWPAMVKAGSKSSTPVCHTDFMATAAALTGAVIPENAAEDSFSLLPELLGTGRSARPSVVHHSIHGQFAIREENWKLAFCAGSGGWSKPGDRDALRQGLPARQLVDLSTDAAEQRNLIASRPEVADRLEAALRKIVSDGRSTPGAPQQNDTAVDYTIARPKKAP